MENTNRNKANAFSSKIGLISGALLVALGLWIIFTRHDSNKAIAYFMVIYGAFRLGLAVYANFLKKKNTDTIEPDYKQE